MAGRSYRSAVVLRHGALGDTIVTIPTLVALRAANTGVTIHLVGNSHARAVLLDCGVIDRFSSADLSWVAALLGPTDEVTRRECLRQLDEADRILAFSSDEDGSLGDHLSRLVMCDVTTIAPLPDEDVQTHITEHLVSVLDIDERPIDLVPTIQPSCDALSEADAWLTERGIESGKPYAVLHPGSGSQKKNWPWERFGEVAEHLRNRLGMPILVRLGPVENEILEQSGERLWTGVIPLEEESLRVVAAILAKAQVYVGADTGISHLAAAVGCRSVVIFGPTDKGLWSPRGDHVDILRMGTSAADVEVSHVLNALSGVLG